MGEILTDNNKTSLTTKFKQKGSLVSSLTTVVTEQCILISRPYLDILQHKTKIKYM